MRKLSCVVAATAFMCVLPAFSGAQSTSTNNNNNSQNSQDVPHQEPGTNNPDVGKQRHPAPKPSTSSQQQQQTDVPHQEPGTNSPDVAKQRHPAPKKKSTRSTATSSSTQ